METPNALAFFVLLAIMPLATLHAAESPNCKTYIYKHSGGAPREMEVWFPPNFDPAKNKVEMIIQKGARVIA